MAQSQHIRFGIMGCAGIARKVSRAIRLSPNAAIVAVGSRSAEKARRFIEDNGLQESTKAHGSYESLLDDPEVDAVYVPLPTSLHLQWATAAARKGKHVLLEKPTALCVAELDQILEACEANNVQFMDGTMWMHHPRTAKMLELLRDPDLFGQLKLVSSIGCFLAAPDFLHSNIRVNPELDSLGVLGDIGWYCIRLILWAADYRLPKTALALPNPSKNEAGLLLACGASLHWEDASVATFHCSFLAHRTFQVAIVGSKGTLTLSDFINPFKENSARFTFSSTDYDVSTEPPQEAIMISEFSRLVGAIRDNSGSKPDKVWPSITRKTQLVLDAVKASIDEGFKPVEIKDA